MKTIKLLIVFILITFLENASAQSVVSNVNGVQTVMTSNDAGTCGLLVTSTMNADLALGTRSANGFWYPRLYVKYNTGNVGIGTSSPAATLDVNGSANINGNIFLSNNFGQKSIYTWNSADENWRIGMSENPNFARAIATSHVQYLTYYSGAGQGFAVGVNGGNSSFEITGSDHKAYFRGNVGIGTATPSSKLQVTNGAIRPFEGNSNSSGISFAENIGGGGGDEAYIRYYVESGENTKLVIGTGNDADDDIAFNQAGAERMTIYNGNVGIGTTLPAAKLDVNGNMNIANEIRFTNASTMKGLVWGSTSNSNYYSRIDDSGNLKILTDDYLYIGQVNSTTGAANSNYTLTANVATGSVFIGFDATNKFSSSPNIATSSLYVSKGVTSENFVMSNVSGWSDFVFAKDYKLPSLEETENFIRTNKHLPNIPSEAEVKKNGYSLHEMNRGLLQTMEEMTLHGIAQEKKINEQEAIVAEQATQIKTMVSELAEIKALLQAKK